ncbi:Holliday junction resolvase RuvX [Alkalimarinus alittae]|uniref:Putative pre-16S rRNA nuclease n=1 Tax=Alkalimarinus alittae TaxID=2961619 RepID=A0ABY6N3G0_9ALTE|nr:Holliday junction resolvase RuvX [Alkalimarinus alittae]UZE96542.1 Holliday junction resolvase RuvX [Alkalimarinus alittae]
MSTDVNTCLGFDFGTRRIGVAVGRSLLGTASPLEPLAARDGIPDWAEIERIVSEWKPDGFVVGLPLNMDGTDSEMSRRATKFGKRLQGRFNKPYFMMDERLSSHEAKGYVIERGGDRDFGRNSVDGIAAVLILESWFAQNLNSA